MLALTYGSLVAAGMNLLTALVGIGIGAFGITTLTGFVDLQSTTPILALMLGLAVGIDYALFIVVAVPSGAARRTSGRRSGRASRGYRGLRRRLRRYHRGHRPGRAGVAGIPFLTEMGLAAAATVVVSVAVAVTLVPAILGFLGRRVLPRKARNDLASGVPARAITLRDRGFFRGLITIISRQRLACCWASPYWASSRFRSPPCRPRWSRTPARTPPRPKRNS